MEPTPPRPKRDAACFFGRFLRRPTRVGAILPSSQQLARVLTGDLSALGPGDLVVEYGPGTGSITQRIAELLPSGVRYLGIEVDETFIARLEARFPQLEFHHGSVADVERILADSRLGRPSRIISGLPFASLPAPVQDAVVRGTSQVLADGGEFRSFQYVHAYRMASAQRFRSAMAAEFSHYQRTAAVVRNVPPAYVLVYSRR